MKGYQLLGQCGQCLHFYFQAYDETCTTNIVCTYSCSMLMIHSQYTKKIRTSVWLLKTDVVK